MLKEKLSDLKLEKLLSLFNLSNFEFSGRVLSQFSDVWSVLFSNIFEFRLLLKFE